MTTATDKKSANHLSCWLIANWKEIEKKRMTKDEATALILKDDSIDFRITPQNVRSAAKVLDYKWPRPKPTGGGVGPRYRETISSLIGAKSGILKCPNL